MTPDLRVRADGRDITGAVRDRFLSVTVTDRADEEADTLELSLDDRPPGIVVPPTGAVLEVDLGLTETGLSLMGSYTVSEVEQEGAPDTLTIRAHAADLLRELKAPRTRSWSLYTIGDVVATIAGRHGLETRVDPALGGIALAHLDQVDESDLSLLRRMASYQLDVVAKVARGRLLFLRRQVLVNELAAAATDLVRSAGMEYRILRADRGRYGSVVAKWREYDAAALQEVRAGSGEPTYSLPDTYPDVASASNAAQTKLRALQRGTRNGSLQLTPGRPDLAADVPLRLRGWGSIDGVWVARSVRHSVSGDGYRTGLDVEAVTEPWERAAAQPLPEAPFADGVPRLGRAGVAGEGSSTTPTTPDLAHVVDRVAAENPEALRRAFAEPAWTYLVLAALRAALGGRWGLHRGSDGTISLGLVAYYRGDGDPAEGSADITVWAIVQGQPPQLFPSWTEVTAHEPGTWAGR